MPRDCFKKYPNNSGFPCNLCEDMQECKATVKLSELNPDKAVDCDGEVVTVESVINKLKNGEIVRRVVTLSSEWVDSILQQGYELAMEGNHDVELISAPNTGGIRVILDMEFSGYSQEDIDKVIDIVKEFCGKDGFSVSVIQRKFKKGYIWAQRLMDQLEARGIVGPFKSKGKPGKDWEPIGHDVLI